MPHFVHWFISVFQVRHAVRITTDDLVLLLPAEAGYPVTILPEATSSQSTRYITIVEFSNTRFMGRWHAMNGRHGLEAVGV
jgi:hypothetical protein